MAVRLWLLVLGLLIPILVAIPSIAIPWWSVPEAPSASPACSDPVKYWDLRRALELERHGRLSDALKIYEHVAGAGWTATARDAQAGAERLQRLALRWPEVERCRSLSEQLRLPSLVLGVLLIGFAVTRRGKRRGVLVDAIHIAAPSNSTLTSTIFRQLLVGTLEQIRAAIYSLPHTLNRLQPISLPGTDIPNILQDGKDLIDRVEIKGTLSLPVGNLMMFWSRKRARYIVSGHAIVTVFRAGTSMRLVDCSAKTVELLQVDADDLSVVSKRGDLAVLSELVDVLAYKILAAVLALEKPDMTRMTSRPPPSWTDYRDLVIGQQALARLSCNISDKSAWRIARDAFLRIKDVADDTFLAAPFSLGMLHISQGDGASAAAFFQAVVERIDRAVCESAALIADAWPRITSLPGVEEAIKTHEREKILWDYIENYLNGGCSYFFVNTGVP